MDRWTRRFNSQKKKKISSYSTERQYKLMLYSQKIVFVLRNLGSKQMWSVDKIKSVICSFRRQADEICALLW